MKHVIGEGGSRPINPMSTIALFDHEVKVEVVLIFDILDNEVILDDFILTILFYLTLFPLGINITVRFHSDGIVSAVYIALAGCSTSS
jgi:hypothetical protein